MNTQPHVTLWSPAVCRWIFRSTLLTIPAG
jgi:hypothetical protein